LAARFAPQKDVQRSIGAGRLCLCANRAYRDKPAGGVGARARAMSNTSSGSEKRSGWSWWYLLFLIQFVAVLWPPFYNRIEPTWIGIPFFYWYQLAWVIISAILTAIVYFATDD
jgi:hypothetical protein